MNNADPRGIHFYDIKSKREMKLITEGSFNGWLCYKHPDGQWVTLREATKEDLAKLPIEIKTREEK